MNNQSPSVGGKWLRRLFIFVIAFIALVGVLAGWFLPYKPIIVAGVTPVPGPYVLPANVPGLKLHVFNTGENRMSSLLVGNERPWRPVPAFVIEHPRQGLIVFDCGIPEAVAREGEAAFSAPTRWLIESRGRERGTLDAQMRAAGLDPKSVRMVIVSHLHEDHTGAASAFSNATFIGGLGVRGHVLSDGFIPTWKEISFTGGKTLAPFDGSLDLFGDGSVTLLPGGGHTPEDVMALIALPGGPALLVGDAIVHRDWLTSDDVQRIASNPQRAADVRNQVRALLKDRPEVVLFPGHDLRKTPSTRDDIVLHHAEWFETAVWSITP